MDRIVDIAPEERTEEQNQVFEQLAAGRGRILTPYRVWIHSPQVAAGMEKVGTYLNKRSVLSTREVELVIIITARHWNSDYVILAHVRAGREVGLDEEALDALKSGRRPLLSDPHEQAVHDFAFALAKGDPVSDDDFARYDAILTRQGIADVLVLLGYYSSVSLAMKVHNVEPRS